MPIIYLIFDLKRSIELEKAKAKMKGRFFAASVSDIFTVLNRTKSILKQKSGLQSQFFFCNKFAFYQEDS